MDFERDKSPIRISEINMASTCRICQRTEIKGLIPLSHSVGSQRKSVFDMLIAIGGSKMEECGEYGRLPQHVCDGCFERLEKTYSLRMMCRHSLRKLLLNSVGGTTDISCCLICCASYDKKELFAVDGLHERWEMKLSDMIEQLIDVELIKDRSQKYTCMSCSIKLYSAYKFKKQCLKSEATWLENVLYPWEKMEVDGSNPEHLVVDLYAEVVEDGEGKAHCSICLLSVDLEQVDNKCEGCMLEFWNDDEMQAEEMPSPAEEESSTCGPLEMNCDEEENINSQALAAPAEEESSTCGPLEMNCDEEENINSQELEALAAPAEEESSTCGPLEMNCDEEENINSHELEALAEEENDKCLKTKSPKVPKPNTGYVEDPEKIFDIIEEYPDDPFPTVRRKGPCCCKCFKFFSTKSDMANHQAESHPAPSCSGTLPCDFCESHNDKPALAQHKQSMDTFVYDFCRSCQIVFESPKLFRKHKSEYHMDPETVKRAESYVDTEFIFYYDCCVPRCFNRYSSEEQLLKHLAVAHGQKKKTVQENTCQYCKDVFVSKLNFLNHWRNEKVLYKCQIDGCNYMRMKKNLMWLHCSQKPHSKYVRKRNTETKILVPDMEHFTVIGELDSNTDILQRQCEVCCRCFLLFDTKEELAAHCELHRVEGDQPFQCQICNRGFESKFGLTNHSQLQETPSHYYCRTCKMFLWRKVDYVNHKVADHLYDDDLSDQIETVENHSFTCCGCWKAFETEEELVGHRRKFHPPSKRRSRKPKCDYCHTIKDTMEMLEQHITFYESKISHRCKVAECFFQTKNMNHMRKHILFGLHRDEAGGTIAIKNKNTIAIESKGTVATSKDAKQNSPELDALAEQESGVERVKTEFTKISKPNTEASEYVEKPEKVFDIIEEYPDEPFPTVRRKGPCCCKCFMFFATKSDLADHQTQSHATSTGSGEFLCDVCLTLYANQQALEQHKKSMDTFVYDFCRSCQIVFESPKLLRKHRLKYHMDPETVKEAESNFDEENIIYYDCCVPRCFNRYSSEEQLLKHCAMAHGQKEVQENTCQYCEAVFNSKSKLLNHCRIEKELYKCQIDGCNYMRIKRHVMWLHCSQKPHSKYVHKRNTEMKMLVPDMKHFTVIGELDNNTEILQRQCQLCCRCLLLFETKEELAVHFELHRVEGRQPFQCQICSKGFESKLAYTNHSQLQETPIHYYCRICKMFLWRKADYVNHKVADHLYDDDLGDQIETVEDHSFTCCGCWKAFETEEELVGHRRKCHPPSNWRSRKPICDYCHTIKDTTEMLDQHITFYESKISHRCKGAGCVFQTKNVNHIRKHILFGHKDEAGDIIAIKNKNTTAIKNKDMSAIKRNGTIATKNKDTVAIKSKDTIAIKRKNAIAAKSKGTIAVNSKAPNDYRCCTYFCDFRCTDYDEMIEHGKAVHVDKRNQFSMAYSGSPFTCLVCCKGFTRLPSLIVHKLGTKRILCRGCRQYFRRNEYLTHVRECTECLKCRRCDKVMSSKHALQKHLHQIHSVKNGTDAVGTMHVCSICGKLRKNIAQHMKGHDKKRIFKCSTCGAGFYKYILLTLHQRTHQNERHFPCRQGCDKRYKAPSDRVRHEKSVHLGIKPFACQLCSESFVRDRDLRMHQRKHTGLKLYPCSYCSASFDKVGDYEDHCMTCVESTE